MTQSYVVVGILKVYKTLYVIYLLIIRLYNSKHKSLILVHLWPEELTLSTNTCLYSYVDKIQFYYSK